MTQNAAIDEGLSNGKDNSASAMKERAAEKLEKGVEAAQETVAQATEQAKLATDQASEEIRKMAETGTKFVRKNPGAAVAGAVGVGILLGLALRGRD